MIPTPRRPAGPPAGPSQGSSDPTLAEPGPRSTPRIAEPPPRRATETGLAAALLLTATGVGLSCVIPDLDINVNDESILNRTPVRIVEPLRISREAEEACDDLDPMFSGELCPQPPPEDPTLVLPHFLDPNANEGEYLFCACPAGRIDAKARPNFAIYVEDRDEDAQGTYDELYAALLLDYDPNNLKPYNSVRYRSYVNPQEPIPLAASIEYEPIGRHDPILRELRLGNENLDFDFCNGATDTALDPGFHTLSVMVTDRPWFTPDDGVIQEGVPNFVEGATFDVSTYVFFCTARDVDPCQSTQCVELGDPL